jgi:cell division protein FtsL
MSARSRSTRYYGREATARVPQPETGLERAKPMPRPRLVTQRRVKWPTFVAFMALAAVFLAVCVISPILLSSRATELESQVGRTESTEAQLSAEITALSSQVSALSSPDRVAEQAAQLGLGPAERVLYVQSGSAATEGDTTIADR